MKTGDLLTDGLGRSWTVGQTLGRGTAGRSWIVRDEHGREAVLKEPLASSDLPSDLAGAEAVLSASRRALGEQADALEKIAFPFLPKLEARAAGGYITPRYGGSLARKIEAGAPVEEVVRLILAAAVRLQESGKVHGNLRPSNVLLNERGDVVLADVLTPVTSASLPALTAALGDRDGWRPPEASSGGSPTPTWDTWALCAALWQAVMARPPSGDGRRGGRVTTPNQGIDKVELAALKDRALARLQEPGGNSNPRFRSRVADKLGSILNRGLSAEREPSPPYRFDSAATLRARLEEIAALIAPDVVEVGRMIPVAAGNEGVFRTGEAVAFSVNVACTPGITDREDLACGLQLLDLDAEERRIPTGDVQVDMKTHPSGRLRFEFKLPEVAPGRYRLKVAFSVRDSGDGPKFSQTEFEVRPPPGWVPPPTEAAPQALQLERSRPLSPASPASSASSADTEVAHGRDSSPSETTSSPGAEVIEGLFPRPLAPPDTDSSSVDVPAQRAPRTEPPTSGPRSIAPVLLPPTRPALVRAEVEASSEDDSVPDSSESEDFSSEAPMPVLHPRPSVSLAPQPSDFPRVVAPPPAPPPPPKWVGPGRWEELPAADDDEIAIGGGLPGPRTGPGEDLPGIDGLEDRPPGLAFDRLLELTRRDGRFAIGGAVAASLLLILITMVLLKAC